MMRNRRLDGPETCTNAYARLYFMCRVVVIIILTDYSEFLETQRVHIGNIKSELWI